MVDKKTATAAASRIAKLRWAKLTPEEREEAARRAGQGNRKRSKTANIARARKAAKSITPEAASERAKKAWKTRRKNAKKKAKT